MKRLLLLVLFVAVVIANAQYRVSMPPYSKWMSEDVKYIITPAERARFDKLTTNEQAETFIEQFWENRNPDPGSGRNMFKEEHYRRIAYANEHFATGVPGWRTDRGHIYIVYGPPDELEAFAPQRREVWRYNHFNGTSSPMTIEFRY